jgi:hypothetical protein
MKTSANKIAVSVGESSTINGNDNFIGIGHANSTLRLSGNNNTIIVYHNATNANTTLILSGENNVVSNRSGQQIVSFTVPSSGQRGQFAYGGGVSC